MLDIVLTIILDSAILCVLIRRYNVNTLDKLKSEGRYFHAGAYAAMIGYGRSYGCHFGMRSTRDYAMDEFYQGYDEATNELRRASIAKRYPR